MNNILLTLLVFIPIAFIFFIIIPLFLRWFFVDRKLKGYYKSHQSYNDFQKKE